MTALAPGWCAGGCAGLALVMCFALLQTRQISGATILLAVQSAAIAVTAIVLRQPVMAVSPLALAAGVWFAPRHISLPSTRRPRSSPHSAAAEARPAIEAEPIGWSTTPVGGAKLGIVAASVLAVLCQSQADLALPLAIVLLSVLLAATRRHPFMHVISLVAIGNGVALAACLIFQDSVVSPALLPLACLLLPLPLAAIMIIPPLMIRHPGIQAIAQIRRLAAKWFGWAATAVSLMVLSATLLVPLDPVAALFAPLLGLDGVMRSCRQWTRPALSLEVRGLALLTSILLVLAVCATSPVVTWLAVLAASATCLLPTSTRHWDRAVAAFLGAGVALFGVLLTASTPLLIGYFSLFAGIVMIAAAVPDLAVVLVILLLRLATRAPWPPMTEALGAGIALFAVLACAAMLANVDGKPLIRSSRRSPVVLLQLCQTSLAAFSICLGQGDARFAAVVVLVLLILTRAAARVADGPIAALAVAGMAGVPPLGLFPGLVLIGLAVGNDNAWLLLPLGAAFIPILGASLPGRLPAAPPRPTLLSPTLLSPTLASIGWLPLILAALVGYLAPDKFVGWCQMLAAGP